MGCWNGTCGVSNLPIHVGDPVVAMLIEIDLRRYGREDKFDDQSGACYATEFGFPITVGFEATYNDYGGVEKIKETALTDLIKERFKVDCLETFVNDVVERDECYKDSGAPVGLWMCHKAVWDKMTNGDLKSGWRGEDLRAKIISDFPAWYEKLKKALEDEDRMWMFEMRDDYDNEFAMAISPGYSDGGGVRNALMPVVQLMKSYVQEGLDADDPKFTLVVNAIAELRMIRAAMGNLRKIWFPQSGKGGQHECYAWYKALWDSSKEVVDARAVKCKEDYDADEDYDIYKNHGD